MKSIENLVTNPAVITPPDIKGSFYRNSQAKHQLVTFSRIIVSNYSCLLHNFIIHCALIIVIPFVISSFCLLTSASEVVPPPSPLCTALHIWSFACSVGFWDLWLPSVTTALTSLKGVFPCRHFRSILWHAANYCNRYDVSFVFYLNY